MLVRAYYYISTGRKQAPNSEKYLTARYIHCVLYLELHNQHLIWASLSEPHTSVTALRMHVCIYISMFGPTTYCKF